jgi:hypothetical protein|tara:strand:- start:1251 stop:1844 length:594 start_codon:yes stop_codon:yes gene_type:complete
MKKILILLLVLIIIGCKSEVSKTCTQDNHCKSVSGCITGCFNKNHLPSQPNEEKYCGMLGPSECSCVDGVCVDTGFSIIDNDCDDLICLNKDAANIKKDEQAVFALKIINKEPFPQTFVIETISKNAFDEQNRRIKHDLIPLVERNTITLNPGEFDKQLLIIRPTKESSKGTYVLIVKVKNQQKNTTSTKQFYVKVL